MHTARRVLLVWSLLAVGTALGACNTTSTSDSTICATCNTGTYGAKCDRFAQLDSELLELEEFITCIVAFALAVFGAVLVVYTYHFKLHDDAEAKAGEKEKTPSTATSKTSVEDGEKTAGTTGATDEGSAPGGSTGTHAVAVSPDFDEEEDDEGNAIGVRTKGNRDKYKGSQARAHGDPNEPYYEEEGATPISKKKSVRKKAEDDATPGAQSTYGSAQYTNGTTDPTSNGQQQPISRARSAHPSESQRKYTISPTPSTYRSRSMLMAGAEADDVPSTALPSANAGSKARTYGPPMPSMGGVTPSASGRASPNQSRNAPIPIIAPPSQSRARSHRQLPPTQNPVADPLSQQPNEQFHRGQSSVPFRGFSTATDLHYNRSASAMPFASQTPMPMNQQQQYRSTSAAAATEQSSGLVYTPRTPVAANTGGLITLDCARPAQVQINEGDGQGHLKFNVTFLDDRPQQQLPQAQYQEVGSSAPPPALDDPKPHSNGHREIFDSTATTNEPFVEEEHQPHGFNGMSGSEQDVSMAPTETPPAEAPPQVPPVIPRLPMFKKGDVIRRNAKEQDAECDFGGFVGSMLCGEVACVQSVERYSANGVTFYSYQVVGGDRAPMIDVESLFTRVAEEEGA